MSDPEFRALPPDRRVEFQQFVDYAFSPEGGPEEYDQGPPDRPGEQYGVFADGDLRSVCTHYEFTASLRGEWVPLAGLASLTTLPEYRRQGYVVELVEGSLRAWRGECPLAALWPFDYGYYEQFGWATGTKVTVYTCEPDALAFARDAPGTLQRVDPEEWELLDAVDQQCGQEYELRFRRDERWWRERIFQTSGGDDRYVYALQRQGEIRGYVAYTFESGDDGRQIEVLYNAFLDHEAFRGLLKLLSNHDSQADQIRLYRPPGSSLLDLSADPRAIDCRVRPGAMVRVVDVVDALEAMSYPEGCTGTLTLAVEDDTAPWNDGRFELAVSEGAGECERIERAEPDLTVDVGTLSQLVVGYHSVEEARRLAGLDVASEEVASRLARWFPSRTVSPPDNF